MSWGIEKKRRREGGRVTQKKKECEEQRIYRGTGRKKEYELFLSLLCVPVTAVLERPNSVMPSGRFNLTISPARKRIERGVRRR